MKVPFIICSTLFLLFFCCHKTEEIPAKTTIPKIASPGTGVVFVYDLTRSDTCLKPDSKTFGGMFYRHVFDGGISLTGIHVLENSQQQQPWLSPVMRADTLPLPSNFILAAKQQKRNRQAILQARLDCDSVAELVTRKLILPQNQNRSDVAQALRLASMAAFGYADKGIKPIVILVSDMVQDIDLSIHPEVIPMVHFPADTELIIIGAEGSVDLKSIFGHRIKIRELPSFQHLTL